MSSMCGKEPRKKVLQKEPRAFIRSGVSHFSPNILDRQYISNMMHPPRGLCIEMCEGNVIYYYLKIRNESLISMVSVLACSFKAYIRGFWSARPPNGGAQVPWCRGVDKCPLISCFGYGRVLQLTWICK